MRLILIVDNDLANRRLTQLILEQKGYKTLLAKNGLDGLKIACERLPDLVITDDDMPGMAGSTLCATLKHSQKTSHIPVILYSARSGVQNPVFLDRIGADGVLLKPCTPKMIFHTVTNLCYPA